MSAAEWETVEQAPVNALKAPVSMLLKPIRAASAPKLWLSVSPSVAEALGWAKGFTIGMAEGSGRRAGWLRFAPTQPGEGRLLKKLGRKGQKASLHAMMQPPPSLDGLEAERAECEHQVQGDVLLVRIPWDLTAARAELAEQVAA